MKLKIGGLFFVSLCCWELIVRLFVLSPAKEVFEPTLGYIHAPYAEVLRSYEGYARFDLDRFGLNNDPLPPMLPEKRVLVIGDSFVESYQVMRGENFVSRLGERWQDVLLLNAGLSGAAPDMALRMVEKLQPDIAATHILLAVNAGDLHELLPAEESRDAGGTLKSLYRPQEPMNRFKAVKLYIYAHSALITHLKWKYEDRIRGWFSAKGEAHAAGKSHVLAAGELSSAVERWRFVLGQLQRTGAKVSVLLLPELEYLPSRQAKQITRQGREVLGREALLMTVPVLDCNPMMARDFMLSGLPALGFANTVYGRGHLNSHGHQLLADWLALQRDVILR